MMARFKMNDLDKMNPELATRIILLHTNDVLKETHGGLDNLTQDLFQVPVPFFTMDDFTYTGVQMAYIKTRILIEYPGVKEDSDLKVEIIPIKDNKGSYRIKYSVGYHYEKNVRRVFDHNSIGTPFIKTNDHGEIVLGPIYKGLGLHKVYVNFLETLFLREFLINRIESICDGSKTPFTYSGDDLSKFLYNFGEVLIPPAENQLKIWKEE